MASYTQIDKPDPFEINEFLGVNEAIGETQITVGEATYMRNFRITNNLKAQKREGYSTLIDCENTKAVYFWYGKITDNVIIFVNNGNVYKYDTTVETELTLLSELIAEGTVTLVGTMTDAVTRMWWFVGKLYFINGVEYKEYDGTTFQDVTDDPYIPTTRTGVFPIGQEGTPVDFEERNLLTGWEIQLCVGSLSGLTFQLPYTTIDADLLIVYIDGVLKTETVDFTVDRTTGIVTFTVAPADDASISIQFKKETASDKLLITQNLAAIDFGPGNDTTIFMWGNPDYINRRVRSYPLKANYFPASNYTDIGRNNKAITDIKVQQSNQLIFKEDSAYRSTAEYFEEKYIYPVYDLNESTGNIAFAQARIISNDVTTLHAHSIKKWFNTSWENKTNEETISDKIEQSLLELDLSTAITIDYQKKNEYWCNVDDIVYIRNYQNDTFYMFDGISATQFLEIDGDVHFGTLGTIEKFDSDNRNDNGVAFTTRMELGFTDLGVLTKEKNTRKCYVSIEPHSRTSLDIYFATNDINTSDAEYVDTVKYVLFDFEAIDFDDFSFQTNRNPQRFALRMRASKYVFIKFIFENKEDDEQLTILDFSFNAESTREVK